MQAVTTVGLDIAKSVFQVHGVDARGNVVVRRQLRRRQVLPFFKKLPSCLVGVEACATSHHWSRQLRALGMLPPKPWQPLHKCSPPHRAAFRVSAIRLRSHGAETAHTRTCFF